MKYEFTLPNFEEQKLALDIKFPLRPKIIVNRKAVKSSTGKWNELAMRRDDGLSSIVTIINQFPDPIPRLEMDEETYHVAPPLNWLERIWAMLPIALVVFEFLGFFIGIVAAYINFWVLRLKIQKLEKNLMIFAINAGAAVILFVIRYMMITSQLGG